MRKSVGRENTAREKKDTIGSESVVTVVDKGRRRRREKIVEVEVGGGRQTKGRGNGREERRRRKDKRMDVNRRRVLARLVEEEETKQG